MVVLLATGVQYTAPAQASEIERLQNEINERSTRLSDIDAEIAAFEAELQEVGAERQTLERAINQLELERGKVTAEIARTEAQLTSTDLEISKLVLEIDNAEDDIIVAEQTIAGFMRQQQRANDQTIVEIMLTNERLSDFMREVDTQTKINQHLAEHVNKLDQLRANLEDKRTDTEQKRSSLVSLKDQFSEQNEVLVNNRAEQSELLSATRSEEAEYQAMLSQKQAARDQLLRELRDFESELQFILDPNTIPNPGTPVFAWPVQNVIITQLFGGTEFARRNASAYGGRPYHPGVDFGAPRGTPILAPLSGTVRAVGNTDAVPGCLSWGKWSLIDHANGLSTLYAHQDVIGVTPGQAVRTGEVIGYIGNTGFSTGPHLHFTVYAKEGVSVRRFNEIKNVTSCGAATTPVAATEAYIDPMLYLPG
jgi:murein DD-endopeptidase MepM/ murein hydrolase activator NlpD